MKFCLVALLLAVGCGKAKEETPSVGSATTARPTVTDPIGFCARARGVMTGRRKCFPEDTSIKMGLDSIAELEASAPADPAKRRRVAAECAVMLDGMMRAEQPKNCPLDVTDGERGELAAFLTAWYGERTAAPSTGNADADAALVKLAALRDEACACKDLACAHAVGAKLDKAGSPVASDAPAAALDASGKMLDEVTRCRQKLTYGAPTP
jgi:hypothetical protein